MSRAYSHYQQNVPGWGTNQLRFGQPPPPTFQPQPDWGGIDYYNAHAINPDSSLYDHAWNQVRQYSGSTVEQGVGKHEAKHWHKRAYGGLGEVGQMQPTEIGHAAAYEAYRTWTHNSSMYEPMSDIERQREGLIGLAVAEASRLLQFANRPMDNYARTAASESAAATASIIFYHDRDKEESGYRRSRSRHRGSFSGSSYDDPYASESFQRPRSHSRRRSHSTSSHQYPGAQMDSSPIPIPSGVGNGYAGSYAGSGYGGNSAYSANSAAYPTPGSYGPQYGTTQYGTTMPMPMPIQGQGSPYGTTSGMPMAVSQSYGASQSYGGLPMALPMGQRQRSTSMSIPYAQPQYSQVQYAQPHQGQYTVPRVITTQPHTIIIGSGHRSHRKKSKRSRSIDYPRRSRSRY
ncbi:hypothetical protein C8F04DRAFT_1255373 [Mycena alexandri]|uniref:Uncharacterized protein n=1 Tax=Mycena alexandri TaxID=1745969 RepID=A0AAD6X4Y7_9AGAR|nr:hypothetical protein C8F04DRAFT_1255373 [Mycena alexandri]